MKKLTHNLPVEEDELMRFYFTIGYLVHHSWLHMTLTKVQEEYYQDYFYSKCPASKKGSDHKIVIFGRETLADFHFGYKRNIKTNEINRITNVKRRYDTNNKSHYFELNSRPYFDFLLEIGFITLCQEELQRNYEQIETKILRHIPSEYQMVCKLGISSEPQLDIYEMLPIFMKFTPNKKYIPYKKIVPPDYRCENCRTLLEDIGNEKHQCPKCNKIWWSSNFI
jgi:hypothetical protein